VHPGIPYVSSSPSGGYPPFRVDAGDCHYFGVGSYLRDLGDARRSAARFVSEGLAFATPPDRPTVDDGCGGAVRAGHDPRWKAALHHDTGRSWDLEDVRDFYVRELFGVDPHLLRYHDPERALDLGRAAVAEIMGAVVTEWRSPEHPCAGALVIALRDVSPGAGWGVIDALGRPKAPWYALARVFAPLALLFADEGLNGLRAHLVNDTGRPFTGTLQVDLYARGELRVERAECPVTVAARASETVEVSELFDGFRDLSYAYRFAPPEVDVVVGTLLDSSDPSGGFVSEAFHLVGGPARRLEPDVGLTAVASAGADGIWSLNVSTVRFAHWVQVEVPGYTPDDSWFHLAPGGQRVVRLHPTSASGLPAGVVRALNSETTARVIREG
jgi:beta-mannosidase